MRDGSQLQAHSVQSSGPTPSSVIRYRLFQSSELLLPFCWPNKNRKHLFRGPISEDKVAQSALSHKTDPQIFNASNFHPWEKTLHKTSQHSLWKPHGDEDDWANTKQAHVTFDSEMAWSLSVAGRAGKKQACTPRCESCVLDCWPGSFSAVMWDRAASCDSMRLNRQDKDRHGFIALSRRTAEMVFSAFCSVCFKGALQSSVQWAAKADRSMDMMQMCSCSR